MVTPDNSTVPAPNELSRRISFATQAAVLTMILGGQFLTVFGFQREGLRLAGILGALAMPFVILLQSVFFPEDSDNIIADFDYAVSQGEHRFLLLLFCLTPVSVILGLWLTRRSRPSAGRHRRP